MAENKNIMEEQLKDSTEQIPDSIRPDVIEERLAKMTMDEKYVFGSLLLEKYITVFNNEEKTLNILKKKEENNKMEIVDNNSSTKIFLIVMLVFILSAVIFILVGKLFGKKLFVSRKKKANELIDDDYDYTPNINNNVISFE